eukprot:126447-Ditylum_brightwellii.AAC.1
MKWNQNHSTYLLAKMIGMDSDDNHMTCLCGSCNKSISPGDIPELSIANAVDFGDYHRLGLTPPNDIEKAIISKSRMYYKQGDYLTKQG